jgi:hypothetical protein
MPRFPTPPDGVLSEMFEDGYAEARKLILEYNDLDAAIECLSALRPESKSDWWRWTDLMGALLFRKGRYAECCEVFASYNARCPGDPRVVSLVRKLRVTNPSCAEEGAFCSFAATCHNRANACE